jgi:hypothetical protein
MQGQNNDFMNLAQQAAVTIARRRLLDNQLKPRDPLRMLHYRSGKLIGCYNTLNDITNEGKNNIFDVYFNNGTQTANNSWFIALLNASGFTAVAATDVMSSHGGWTEFTSYTETTRVAWGSGAASGQSVTNATPATFDINGSGTVKGVFIVTNSAKSGTTGKLWATALFGADVPVTNGDQLKITYTVSA